MPFIISEQTGYEEVYIREVIKYCRTIGLFSDEVFLSDNILTSKGIQKRYLQMCASAKRKGDVTDYCLIDELFSSSKLGFLPKKLGLFRKKLVLIRKKLGFSRKKYTKKSKGKKRI